MEILQIALFCINTVKVIKTLPCGSVHVKDEDAVLADSVFLSNGCQSSLDGRSEDESQGLEEREQRDVGRTLRLVGRLRQIRSARSVDCCFK